VSGCSLSSSSIHQSRQRNPGARCLLPNPDIIVFVPGKSTVAHDGGSREKPDARAS
jgi:hypothetical protein